MDAAEGIFGVHVVEAGAAQGHDAHPELAQAVDDGGIDRVVDEYADGLAAAGQRHGILGQLGLVEFEAQLIGLVGGKGLTVIGLGVEKCNLHTSVSFLQRDWILPSGERITTSQGMSRPQAARARRTACSMPPQQGTCIRTTVTL